METISKALSAASTALWPQSTTSTTQPQPHGEEPLSGIQGQGTATDPYDAGNRLGLPPPPPYIKKGGVYSDI